MPVRDERPEKLSIDHVERGPLPNRPKGSDMPTYPQPWLDAAAEAAHQALGEVESGWHAACLHPDGCGKGFRARAMLVEDVMPRVLAALEKQGALTR